MLRCDIEEQIANLRMWPHFRGSVRNENGPGLWNPLADYLQCVRRPRVGLGHFGHRKTVLGQKAQLVRNPPWQHDDLLGTDRA